MVLRAKTFMQRCFYTGMLSSKQKLLHTDAWVLLHTNAWVLLHTDAWVLLHADAFTQRCFYRGMLSHGILHRASFDTNLFSVNTLMQRCFFTQKHMCTMASFYAQILLQKGFLHGYFYGERLLHTGAFRLGCV